jgi:hypothetical protein
MSHGDCEVVISDFITWRVNGYRHPGPCTGDARQITGLLSTAHGSDEVRKRAGSFGAVYMEKPVQLQELETTPFSREQAGSAGIKRQLWDS